VFSGKRRDSTRVIFDILSLSKTGASKTRIVYGANLNFRLVDRYLSLLMTKGLVLASTDDAGLTSYVLSDRGERLLGFLSEVQRELEPITQVLA